MTQPPHTLTGEFVAELRREFPALARSVAGRPAVYFDGPGGTQVPQRVIDAVGHYLAHTNANHGGHFPVSRESDAVLAAAQRAAADLLGANDPATVAFGANMTTLTFALARALARTWRPGDEVIVTRLDHDANVAPWVLAARDAGAVVRTIPFRGGEGTLDLAALRAALSERTRLVAVGCASNSLGTVNPVADITRWAHEAGALVFLDAVHYAPHALIDVEAWECDFLACSAYKFFGPHVGLLWGRRRLLEDLEAYKVRPAPNELPGKWMTGTQNHEGIAGTLAAIDYLADIGRRLVGDANLPRRAALQWAFAAINRYECGLAGRLLSGLAAVPGVRVFGVTEPSRSGERLPTVSITLRGWRPAELAQSLGDEGIFVWHGNYYALGVTESLGLEPDGMLRIGLVHYNTADEVDRLLAALRARC